MTAVAPSILSAAPTSQPTLRPARLEDYPQIQRLEESLGLLTLSPADWRRVWQDNPAKRLLRNDFPIGWVLQDGAGRIVGSMANVPTLYTHRGRELVAATGRAWVVEPQYRGIALWLMDEYFAQSNVDLFINTTVNGLAVDAFSAFGSQRVPIGDWENAAYFITNYSGFARTALLIKNVPAASALAPIAGAALRLRYRSTAHRASGLVDVKTRNAFGTDFDAFWQELIRQNPDRVLANRDSKTMHWHFSPSLAVGQCWILVAESNGLMRAYAIFKRQDHPPSGLVRMRLVDYQSLDREHDFLPELLDAALKRCRRQRIHTLEHVGCGLPKMSSFDRTAPLRRKLPAWPFYYFARDAELMESLKSPDSWDPSNFDGDASL